MKIDLVYLWVDGADSAWRERKATYISDVDQSDSETFCKGRTIDSDELLYSLRSVERYAPWINHIYIVTDKQTPKWFNPQNPKISIVDHTDLFPPEVLPLFNSAAIELGVHRIEGLSEHYLYANDDMMLGRAVTPNDFFDSEGRPKCHFLKNKRIFSQSSQNSTYNSTIKGAIDAITSDFGLECGDWTPHHQIDSYSKSSVERCVKKYKKWCDATLSNRFRTRDDMQRHIFSLYAVALGDGESIIIRRAKALGIRVAIHKFLTIDTDIKSLYLPLHKKSTLHRLKHLRPKMFCINDTAQTKREDRTKMKRILDHLYPQKSQFEIGNDNAPIKVDLVYLWVDGSDKEWKMRRDKTLYGVDQSDTESFCEGRSADNEELRYSLRSVEMYAPWINHIYIVTDKQCPQWLDTQNPKISIIDHTEILPNDVLPLYNSCAIELAIHRIEGLSEHYLYANDDMMFGRELSPEFFFDTEGKPKCRFNLSKRVLLADDRLNTYMSSVKGTVRAINKDFGLGCLNWATFHQIDPYLKSSVAKCVEHYKEWSDRTISNRFRTREDMQRHILSLYAVASGDGVAILYKKKRFKKLRGAITRLAMLLGASKGVTSQYIVINRRNIKRNIKRYKPALICFNDSEKVSHESRIAIKEIFQELYPNKSTFER